MEEMHINHLAVIVAALSSLVIGGVWYSPLLFFKAWQKETGLTDEQLKKAKPAITYTLTLVLSLIMAYNLAFFLGNAETDWQWGLTAGALAGFGWCTLIFAVVALFEQRSFRYIAINGGYITLWFCVAGLILGAWR